MGGELVSSQKVGTETGEKSHLRLLLIGGREDSKVGDETLGLLPIIRKRER